MARYDFRLAAGEFELLPLKAFVALARRHRLAQQVQEAHQGKLLATIVNSNPWRGKDSPIAQPWDFYPSLQELQPKPRGTEGILREIMRGSQKLLGAMGKVNRSRPEFVAEAQRAEKSVEDIGRMLQVMAED